VPVRGRPALAARDDEPKIAIADVEALSLETGRRLITRQAGVFLFLPLLARLRFDQLIERAGYPGTQMVPAVHALLSLLVLKLLDKERLTASTWRKRRSMVWSVEQAICWARSA
jgi:hypothetical protein